METGNGEVFRLHLLRHAHAGWPEAGRKDFERTLDAQGQAEAHDIARKAANAGVRPHVIISSPALRCLETTEIVLRTAGGLSASYDEGLYSGGIEAYMDHIRANVNRESLMLVGHNPMIEGLAALLTVTGLLSRQLGEGYPTAGLLSLEFDRPLPLSLFHQGRAVRLIAPDLT
jgi:phosphohistidine phosphatase